MRKLELLKILTFKGIFFGLLFFLMWTIFEVFIEFVTILFLFYVLFFWLGDMWDFSSPTRDEPTSPALEGDVLTTGQPGTSQGYFKQYGSIVRSFELSMTYIKSFLGLGFSLLI